jgi:hypothetical protein
MKISQFFKHRAETRNKIAFNSSKKEAKCNINNTEKSRFGARVVREEAVVFLEWIFIGKRENWWKRCMKV